MFQLGKIYSRRHNIHEIYGGQRQGGISTPANSPYVFLFTGDSGEIYGYNDSFRPDGTFWYTGEGQAGHMQMTRGNLAIVEHAARNKQLLIFEYVSPGFVQFLGQAEYLDHHIEERPDRDNKLRNALVFHLGLLPLTISSVEEPKKTYSASITLPKKLSLAALRRAALEVAPPSSSTTEKRSNLARRAEAVRRYALARANGICEGCLSEAPFFTSKGPYLEVHHVFRLSDGGPDHPAAVVAICPNCHRRAHHATDAVSFNSNLVDWLKDHEEQDIGLAF